MKKLNDELLKQFINCVMDIDNTNSKVTLKVRKHSELNNFFKIWLQSPSDLKDVAGFKGCSIVDHYVSRTIDDSQHSKYILSYTSVNRRIFNYPNCMNNDLGEETKEVIDFSLLHDTPVKYEPTFFEKLCNKIRSNIFRKKFHGDYHAY